jgi:hypothetical protein
MVLYEGTHRLASTFKLKLINSSAPAYSVFQLAENSHSKFEFLRRFSTFDILSGVIIAWADFSLQKINQRISAQKMPTMALQDP